MSSTDDTTPRWLRPEPVVDVGNLDHIASLPDLAFEKGEQDDQRLLLLQTDREAYQILEERRRYRRWLRDARVLAAQGVRVAPSHQRYVTSDGGREWGATFWGAFHDAATLAEQLAVEQPERFNAGEPLVLWGMLVEPGETADLNLPAGPTFHAVAVQTAGVLCHHRYLVGTPLALSDRGARIAHALDGFGCQDGRGCVSQPAGLSELAAYHRLLEHWGITSEHTWADLEEGIYPVDRYCTHRFSDDVVPSDEDMLVALQGEDPVENDPSWASLHSVMRPWDLIGRWRIFVLGKNCD